MRLAREAAAARCHHNPTHTSEFRLSEHNFAPPHIVLALCELALEAALENRTFVYLFVRYLRSLNRQPRSIVLIYLLALKVIHQLGITELDQPINLFDGNQPFSYSQPNSAYRFVLK